MTNIKLGSFSISLTVKDIHNPGWDENAQNIENFDDVRAIQTHLISSGVELTREADPNTSGPEYITLTDPDGNNILIDQHR